MNKKISKITTWLSAAVFLFALAINVKVTLDDPFVIINDQAFASSTGQPCTTTYTTVGNTEQCYCDQDGEYI